MDSAGGPNNLLIIASYNRNSFIGCRIARAIGRLLDATSDDNFHTYYFGAPIYSLL